MLCSYNGHRRLYGHLCPSLLFLTLLFSEEGDDDDDPEYNFLEDIDEPDLEDYRNDRAVRITSGFLASLDLGVLARRLHLSFGPGIASEYLM